MTESNKYNTQITNAIFEELRQLAVKVSTESVYEFDGCLEGSLSGVSRGLLLGWVNKFYKKSKCEESFIKIFDYFSDKNQQKILNLASLDLSRALLERLPEDYVLRKGNEKTN